MKRMFTGLLLTVGVLGVSGCSSTPSGYSDANFSVLKTDVVEGVCSLSGVDKLTEDNKTRLLTLADNLEGYKGEREKEVYKLAGALKQTADAINPGVVLSGGDKTQLTNICEKVKKSWG